MEDESHCGYVIFTQPEWNESSKAKYDLKRQHLFIKVICSHLPHLIFIKKIIYSNTSLCSEDQELEAIKM